MTRTTPERPLDIEEVIPELVGYRGIAIRLHPRPGAPDPKESSVGGPFLWPAGESRGPSAPNRTYDGSASASAMSVCVGRSLPRRGAGSRRLVSTKGRRTRNSRPSAPPSENGMRPGLPTWTRYRSCQWPSCAHVTCDVPEHLEAR